MSNQLSISILEKLIEDFTLESKSCGDLEVLRLKWLSKDGIVKNLFKELKTVPVDEKPQVAEKLNLLKDLAESFVKSKQAEAENQKINQKLAQEFIDLSLPANDLGVGHLHPITQVENQITAILAKFGFKQVEGPEAETEYYCFDALNIPKHHPARDLQDTFYTSNGLVLRTHTTAILSREFEKRQLPLKNIYCGRVYRNEKEDASHQAMFHQYDLVWIEEGLTQATLMGLLEHTIKELYGENRRVRFVPKFYPYTEPSFGTQIDCALCQGSGCNFCKGAGWVTILGAGMVHENVIKEFGYDPQKIGGFAFGFGTSRMAAQAFNAPNLKILYDGDLRYLGQI